MSARHSDSIAAIATAMAAAQGEIEGAAKGKVNPHFRSAYADLASVWDACRVALSKQGIAVFQTPSAEGPSVTITTLLAHKSGEWIAGDLTMTAQQNTPQGIGSCITYARRYALAAMVGVAPEDDDGNAASQQPANAKQPEEKAEPPKGYQGWFLALNSEANRGLENLKSFWSNAPAAYRQHLTTTNPDSWEDLKAHAATVKPPKPEPVSA